MKILVTGHNGFIGSHYYDYVSKTENVFTFKDNEDLKDSKIVMNSPECDVIVHLAAINGTRLFYDIPTEISFNNTLPTFNLIQRYLGTNTKFVFASTCEIFNTTIDRELYPIPTDENVPIMFDDITNPRWSYSLPKALGENLVANCGLPWLVIRYFNIYGPRQVNHFITEFVDRVKNGEYYIKGDDTRSFCYVEDAVNITHILVKKITNEIINVGKQEEHRISDVARMIMDIMEVDPNKLEILPGPKGSAKRRCPDTNKLLSLTNYKYQYTLEQGLKLTVESLL